VKNGSLGVNLWFEDSGDGFPVILLHGGLVHSGVWDGLTAELSSQYRVIRFDARGHGKSMMSAGPFSRVDDLVTVMDALSIERAALIGLSMGGGTAIDFALEYPDRVAGLALIAPALDGFQPSETLRSYWREESRLLEVNDLEGAAELSTRVWTDGRRESADVNPEARARVKTMTLQNYRLPVPDAEEREADMPAIERLPEITAPTLVMIGADDVPDFVEIADTLEREIPGARKVVFEDAAHHLPLEHPSRFQALVLEFLAGIA
jgi:3-oxoadipate enol-lactonase